MCLFPVLCELDVVRSSSIFPLLRALEEAEEDEVTSGSGFLVRFDSLVLPVDAAVFFFLFLFPTLAEREIEGEAGEVNEQKEKVKCHPCFFLPVEWETEDSVSLPVCIASAVEFAAFLSASFLISS